MDRNRYRWASAVILTIGLSMLSCKMVFPDTASKTATALVVTQGAQTAQMEATNAVWVGQTMTALFAPPYNLTKSERHQYLVILRYITDPIQIHFQAVLTELESLGYMVEIDSGPSGIGDMDVILYGAPACLDAIDDMEKQLDGLLNIRGLDRVRFDSGDTGYTQKHIVIQIKDIDRFV